MKVEGLGWLGIRREGFEETARFFREVMGPQEARRGRLRVPRRRRDGGLAPRGRVPPFFGAGPVVGLRVGDVEAARAAMEAAGVAFLGPVQRSERAVWSHFRGPDGNVYEIIARR